EPTFVDAAPATSVEDLVDLIRWRIGKAPTGQPPGREPLGAAASSTRLLATLGQGIGPDERRVLLVDEPPSGEVGHTFFGRLRDELWQLPFTWVVAIEERRRAAL